MSGANAGGMHNQRLPVVLLTCHNSSVLSGKSSVESSILTVEPPGGVAVFLNQADRPAPLLGWGKAAANKEMVELLGQDNM